MWVCRWILVSRWIYRDKIHEQWGLTLFLFLLQVTCYCFQKAAIDWTMSPWNAHVKALTPMWPVFGDRSFRRQPRLNEVAGSGPWSHKKTRRKSSSSLCRNTPRKGRVRKLARREPSLDTNPASSLFLDVKPPELWEMSVVEATQSVEFCYGYSSQLRQKQKKKKWNRDVACLINQ